MTSIHSNSFFPVKVAANLRILTRIILFWAFHLQKQLSGFSHSLFSCAELNSVAKKRAQTIAAIPNANSVKNGVSL